MIKSYWLALTFSLVYLPLIAAEISTEDVEALQFRFREIFFNDLDDDGTINDSNILADESSFLNESISKFEAIDFSSLENLDETVVGEFTKNRIISSINSSINAARNLYNNGSYSSAYNRLQQVYFYLKEVAPYVDPSLLAEVYNLGLMTVEIRDKALDDGNFDFYYNSPQGNGIPIDGGLVFLLLGGVGLGYLKLKMG